MLLIQNYIKVFSRLENKLLSSTDGCLLVFIVESDGIVQGVPKRSVQYVFMYYTYCTLRYGTPCIIGGSVNHSYVSFIFSSYWIIVRNRWSLQRYNRILNISSPLS